MDVLVIGAGLAGLAVSDALLRRGVGVTLYDKSGVAAAASGVAAGLLHPLPARKAKLGWRAFEAFQLTRAMAQRLAQRDDKIICGHGVWRPDPMMTNPHCATVAARCDAPPQGMPQIIDSPGWWFADGLVLDTARYCRTWLQDLQERGLVWCCGNNTVKHRAQHIVLCTGAELAARMPDTFNIVRGQVLVLPRDPSLAGIGVAGPIYLAPVQEQLIVGSTFEHDRQDLEPAIETVRAMLSQRLAEAWAGAFPWSSIKRVMVGLRCTTRSRLPCLGITDRGEFFLGGLGSKGLLYHCLMGELLADAIVAQSLSILPTEVTM